MTKEPSRDADSIEQHLARLAAIVEQHGLTHLEYEIDGGRVVLDKEVPAPAVALAPAMPAGLSAEDVAALSELADDRTGEHRGAGIVSRLCKKAYDIQAGETVATGGAVAPAAATAAAGSDGTAADSAAADSAGAAGAAGTNAGEGEMISAPLVGLVYGAKEPGAKPFVSVGDKVEEGSVLCLIEAMKMFNEVKAPNAGTITKIHFKDGALVEYGAALFSLQA